MGSSGRESFRTVEGACARQDRDRRRSLVLARLEEAMVDGMDGVPNAPDVEGPHVPVETEVRSGKTWAG